MARINQTRLMFSRERLARIRTIAIRKGVWYKTLDKAERGLVELTIRIVKRIGSPLLKRVLTSIFRKLQTVMENKIAYFARKAGRQLAEKLSLIAQSWGNASAFWWRAENNFIRFLTVIHVNTPSAFKSMKPHLLKRG